MKDFVKYYTITLVMEGPVFIASGQSIGKKEYLFDAREKQVSIPDMPKLYRFLKNHRLLTAYETYMIEGGGDLLSWLRRQGISAQQCAPWIAYSIDSGNAVFENRSKKEIATFLKDAYGCPYIPGSSLKGALRTVLLASELVNQPQKFVQAQQGMRNMVRSGEPKSMIRKKARVMFRKEAGELEQRAFHTLGRNRERMADAVNDMLGGLQIGDSAPVSVKDLVLCQKIDVLHTGEQRQLPILRECLKPGTELQFPLRIDTRLCKITPEQISKAATDFVRVYESFLQHFPMDHILGGGNLYLGGGCGFLSKTVLYPLFFKSRNGFQTAVNKTSDILAAQFWNHKHDRDRVAGISPRTVKCTKYHGELYEMGACTMEITDFTPH